jgi:8-oxo-dGTP diphosphatase
VTGERADGAAPSRAVVETAIAVIEDAEGRVLVSRRRAGGHLGGLFEFPGGKVEAGESPEAACRRECREELGVEVAVLGPALPRFTHPYAGRTVALHFLRCALRPGSPAPRALAAEEVRWVARADLPSLAWPEANREIVRRLAGLDGDGTPPPGTTP